MAKLTREEILQKKAKYCACCAEIIRQQERELQIAIEAYKEGVPTATKEERKNLKRTVKEEKKLLKRLIKIQKHHVKSIGKEKDDDVELVPPNPEIFDSIKNNEMN